MTVVAVEATAPAVSSVLSSTERLSNSALRLSDSLPSWPGEERRASDWVTSGLGLPLSRSPLLSRDTVRALGGGPGGVVTAITVPRGALLGVGWEREWRWGVLAMGGVFGGGWGVELPTLA